MSLAIDFMYMEDDQDWHIADDLLRQALADLGLEATIDYWLVETDRQAFDWFFYGSPTIRVNGDELFPPFADSVAGQHLRSYFTEEGVLGYPTYKMLVEALQVYA
ncbi:MAG: thioredoxin family protein [Chloroflexi bacterium]|nr:thioredoxin family protein [Chloroflexota bacterium]